MQGRDIEDSLVGRWKCYALTTSDRPDRVRHIHRELVNFGLPFTVHESVRPTEANGFASAGYYGCFLAHLSCLRQAKADGVEVAIIVEDDAVIASKAARIISAIDVEQRDIDWKVMHLGYLSTSPCYVDGVERISNHLAYSRGWEVTGAHFYAVRASAIDDVIANFEARLAPEGHRIACDGILNEFLRDNDSRVVLAVPRLAQQGPSPSGLDFRPGLRTNILRFAPTRQLVELAKRRLWNVDVALGPTMSIRRWDRRARRAAAPSA
jgi:GR25 family glycosyltransferase involved in LPS biosynthesis